MTATTPADSDQPVGSGRVQPVPRRARRPAPPGRLQRRRALRRLVVDRLELVEDRRLQALRLQVLRILAGGVHARQR